MGKGLGGSGQGIECLTPQKPLPLSKGKGIPSVLLAISRAPTNCQEINNSNVPELGLVRDADLLAAAALPDVMEDKDELNVGWNYITY